MPHCWVSKNTRCLPPQQRARGPGHACTRPGIGNRSIATRTPRVAAQARGPCLEDELAQQLVLQAVRRDGEVHDGGRRAQLGRVARVGQPRGAVQLEGLREVHLRVRDRPLRRRTEPDAASTELPQPAAGWPTPVRHPAAPWQAQQSGRRASLSGRAIVSALPLRMMRRSRTGSSTGSSSSSMFSISSGLPEDMQSCRRAGHHRQLLGCSAAHACRRSKLHMCSVAGRQGAPPGWCGSACQPA